MQWVRFQATWFYTKTLGLTLYLQLINISKYKYLLIRLARVMFSFMVLELYEVERKYSSL